MAGPHNDRPHLPQQGAGQLLLLLKLGGGDQEQCGHPKAQVGGVIDRHRLALVVMQVWPRGSGWLNHQEKVEQSEEQDNEIGRKRCQWRTKLGYFVGKGKYQNLLLRCCFVMYGSMKNKFDQKVPNNDFSVFKEIHIQSPSRFLVF